MRKLILMLVSALVIGCNDVVLEPVGKSPVKILVCGGMNLRLGDIQKSWPGGELQCLRAMNTDLKIMGATHRTVGDKTVLIEIIEMHKVGLRAVPFLIHWSYGETLDNVVHNMNRSWAWVDGLRAVGLLDDIDMIWVADDVKDDGRGSNQGPRMRAHLKKLMPNISLMVSPTSGSSATYGETMLEPKPDIVLRQIYPFHAHYNPDHKVDEEQYEAFVSALLTASRPQDGFWFPAFGHPNWNEDLSELSWGHCYYAPPPGRLYKLLRRVWDEGHRGPYGLFVLNWENDSHIGLYDRKMLLEQHNWKEARTYLWYEVQKFVQEIILETLKE